MGVKVGKVLNKLVRLLLALLVGSGAGFGSAKAISAAFLPHLSSLRVKNEPWGSIGVV